MMTRSGAIACLMLALMACAAPAASPPPRMDAAPAPSPAPITAPVSAPAGPQPPRSVLSGLAEMAIAPVEANVPGDEVLSAVSALVAAAPVCASWPALWLEASDRRSVFIARYGLMTRDWGDDVAADARARMDEFVEMGFLQRRARDDLGDGAVEYQLTDRGRIALQGSPYMRERPRFCGPSERRVVEIVATEFGRFPCGSMRVRFRHVADAWPRWASGPLAQERMGWPPLGEASEGVVTLSRQWFSSRALPRGQTNGSLQSVCFDEGRVVGGDLELFPAP